MAGVLVYGYLAVAARTLPAAEYGWFGAYWSLTLVVGFGLFLPLEIELARVLHVRGPAAGLPPGTLRATAGLTALAAVAVIASWPLLRGAVGVHEGVLAGLLVICVLSGAQFLLRGLLMGQGRLRAYGATLVIDGAARVAAAALVALLVSEPTLTDFVWTHVAAVALAHLPLLGWVLRRGRRGPAPTRDDGHRVQPEALGHLMLASLCGQALLNSAPVLVTNAATPAQHATAAAFVATFTLVRLPLFVAVPLQSALVRPLTEVRSSGGGPQRRFLLRLAVAIVVGAALTAAVGALAGPPLVAALFGERYVLPGGAVALLAIGSVLHLGLLVSSQALVAAERHRAGGRAWAAGLLAAAVVFAVVPGLVARAALAFTVGSAVALAWTLGVLLRGTAPVIPRATDRDGAGVP